MEINGLHLAFLDIPPEYTQEYNRWYDLDHMPEHVAKADVVMGRRYVADRSMRDLPGVHNTGAFGGHAPYLSIYSFGGPLDMMSDEARGLWRTLDNGIVRQGRYWQAGKGVGGGMFRVRGAAARASCLVSTPAIAHLNHRGVIVAYGKAPTPEQRPDAVWWWERTHLPDLLVVPGVLAALRGDPADTSDDHILHVILCEDSPKDVMPRIADAMRYAGAIGRFPAHKGVYVPEAFLPYERIVPLEYDFDFSTD
jgi:hypothetical protein